LKGTYEHKRMLWLMCTWMFLGSFRVSEILGDDKNSYDPVKTLLAQDLERSEPNVNGEKITMLRIKVKQPKTARYMPEQFVELPRLGGWLCPVMAYDEWLIARKGKPPGGKPLFTMKESGQIFTSREFNKLLEGLLNSEGRKITSSCFRAGLATILARQGVSTEVIKMMGRWTSTAFNAYVKQGRCNNWNQLFTVLKGLQSQSWE
jgi:hypothetical protein